jgi:hypothetical protein
MPRLFRKGSLQIYFFSNEGCEPPHVHVSDGAKLAKYWLEDIELASNRGFRGHELRAIRRIIEQHQGQFLEAWHDHFDED